MNKKRLNQGTMSSVNTICFIGFTKTSAQKSQLLKESQTKEPVID